jgi:hypothetical protein
MKKIVLISLIASLYVVGCQSSAPAPQIVTAQSQATDINPNQRTDRGWADIVNYLYEFDQKVTDAGPKPDSSVVMGLEEVKANVQTIDIDACTEGARKSVISGLDNRIKGMQFLASGDDETAFSYIHYGNRLLILARDELKNYGIELKYPK